MFSRFFVLLFEIFSKFFCWVTINNFFKSINNTFQIVLSSFNVIFLYWHKSHLNYATFPLCVKFRRIRFFCLSASCSHFLLYFFFPLLSSFVDTENEYAGPIACVSRISRTNELVKLHEPLPKSFILNESFYFKRCYFL